MFEEIQSFPKTTFFEFENQKISFFEWKLKVNQISTWLKTLALKENSLVLINVQNPLDFLILSFACMTQKIIPCYLNFYFKEPQIKDILKENKYSLYIRDESAFEIEIPTVYYPDKEFFLKDTYLINEFFHKSFQLIPEAQMVFYSSGSVQSKACVITLENMLYNALGSYDNIAFHEGHRWGACLPLFHVGGFSLFVRALLNKGTISWIDNKKSLSEQINNRQLSHLSLVSTQLIRLIEELKKSKQILSSLKYILLGGSSIPQRYIMDALELELPILKSYGMTEMCSQICTTKVLTEFTESSGQVLKYRDLKIKDKNIFVRGPCLFSGYIKKNTVELLLKDEWFETNDLGELRNDEVFILGRKDRIFQSAGENISPEQIENEILKINGVKKAYVLAVDDSEYGKRAVAYIEKSEDLSENFMHQILKERLSLFWRPKEFRPWDTLPKKSWKL